MRYMVPQYSAPIVPQYIPPNGMGQPAQPIASSSLWMLGLVALGLFLYTTSERKHSRWF